MEEKNEEVVRAVFKFPDGKNYEGEIKQVGAARYELSVDDLPEQAWPIIEQLEATVKKEDDKFLFKDVYSHGSSSFMNRTGNGTTVFFSPTITFRTNEPDNPLSSKVRGVSASVGNLDLWFNRSLFILHNPMKMKDTLEYSLQENVGIYNFKGFVLEFELSIGGMRFWRFTRSVNLTQGAHISLFTSDSSIIEYSELVSALHSVERLISLAFQSPIRTAAVSVTSDYGLTVGDSKVPNIFPMYDIYLSNIIGVEPESRLGDELAFTLDQVPDFQHFLDRWIELEKKIGPVVDLYLTSVSGGSSVLENIFLNRVQAIEAFHRSFRPGTLKPQDEYDAKVACLISGFSGEDRKFLKSALKRGNDLSLEKRLSALRTELQLLGIHTLGICEPSVVANTRNYLSHYSETITDICPDDSLSKLTNELGQMLFALILLELGLDKGIVLKSIRRADYI